MKTNPRRIVGLLSVGILALGLVASCQNPMQNAPAVPGAQETASRAAINGTLRQEAENWTAMSGVQTEASSEGGLNVGWIDAGDWLAYQITVPTAGSYRISYRVASPNASRTFTADINAGATVLGTLTVPNTGNWQTWQTVSHTVTLPAGTYNFGLYSPTGGFNLNWIEFTSLAQPTGTRVEAEAYALMSGIITEPSSGGTRNVGSVDPGDWMVYNLNIPSAGTYTIEYRVASIHSGKSLIADLNAGATVLGSVAIPNTGNWQTWQTVSHSVSLPAGNISFGINAGTGGWNLDWFAYTRTGDSGGGGNTNTKHGKTLVWEDQFTTNGLPSSARWGYDLGGGGWGNNELQTYTNSTANVWAANGILTIRAIKDGAGNWTSARIVTRGKGDWKYGYFEMRAKLPTGRGTWPAFWMLPTDGVYGGWPKSGEIDIMEHVGYDQDVVHTTIHTEAFNHMIGTQKAKQTRVNGASTGFHNYGVLWNANQLQWYIDDVLVYTIDRVGSDGWPQWPFDQRFHLILNLAMGGNWGAAMGMDPNLSSASYEIDWVRVYQ